MNKTVSFNDKITVYHLNGSIDFKALSEITTKPRRRQIKIDPDLIEFVLPSPQSELSVNIDALYSLPVNEEMFTFIVPETHNKKKVSKIERKGTKLPFLKFSMQTPQIFEDKEKKMDFTMKKEEK